MSIRLFHRGARIVLRTSDGDRDFAWCAMHRRAVPWADLFAPALTLVGFTCERDGEALRFGDGGRIHWTKGPLWTTIRLRLPPCSEKKAALLEAGLLKAARYG